MAGYPADLSGAGSVHIVKSVTQVPSKQRFEAPLIGQPLGPIEAQAVTV